MGVVSGRKLIDDGSGAIARPGRGPLLALRVAAQEWETATGSVAAVAGEILAFRREAFRAPSRGFLTEDFAHAMLAALDGWRIVYAPAALSVERASATVGDEAVRRARIVSGRWQALAALLPRLAVPEPVLAIKVISHKGLRPLVPAALATAAVFERGCGTSRAIGRECSSLRRAPSIAAALAGRQNERRGRRSRLLFLPYYFCRMNLASVSGLVRFLRNKDSTVWAKVRRG